MVHWIYIIRWILLVRELRQRTSECLDLHGFLLLGSQSFFQVFYLELLKFLDVYQVLIVVMHHYHIFRLLSEITTLHIVS